MDEQRLRAFLRESVGFMENESSTIGSAAFPPGKSGLSYGKMQNDVANNGMARAALGAMLMNGGLPQEDWEHRLEPVLAKKGLTAGELEDAYPGALGRINDALVANREFVNNLDDATLTHVVDQVKGAFAAAASNAARGPGALDPENPDWNMVAKLGAWANRTGDLEKTNTYLRGAPQISREGYSDYLQSQKQFTKPNPEDYANWSGRLVNATRRGWEATGPEPSFEQPGNLFNSAPPAREPEVRLWNRETDSTAPAPGNLFNVDALPENLFNMPDYEMRKWGLR